jgi:thiazolinyl imide reductase
MGGRGTELALQLMTRGIHVLQEHPVHHDELLQCLELAARHGVVYRLNSFYPQLAPVRQFIQAGRRLLAREEAIFLDAACAVQVSFPLFDILAQLVGSVRPWQLNALPQPSHTAEPPAVFRSLEGVLGGVPCTLRIQNQIDASDPDNTLHILHRVSLGTASGNLTLFNTHGPLLWSPRLHVAPRTRETLALSGGASEELDVASVVALGNGQAPPTFRHVLEQLWPDAVLLALQEMRRSIAEAEDPRRVGQYQLALCKAWQAATGRLGYPQPVVGIGPPRVRSAELWPQESNSGSVS